MLCYSSIAVYNLTQLYFVALLTHHHIFSVPQENIRFFVEHQTDFSVTLAHQLLALISS